MLLSCFKKKYLPPKRLAQKVRQLRQAGIKIATLNGSFDLLHAGHLYILQQASRQADRLFVLLNSDESIKRYKSAQRPIIALTQRLQMISSLECVDFVSWFAETDPCKILQTIQPDVHVNGSEYGRNCLEAPTVTAAGGRIHIVDLVPGLSTSQIIHKIRTTCDS